MGDGNVSLLPRHSDVPAPTTMHKHGQVTDTTPFLNVSNQRYEDPDQERMRNRFPLATLLEVNPQNYQRVTSSRPDFVLDTEFPNLALPMLALPPQNLPHSPPTAVDPLVTKNVEPSNPAPDLMKPNVQNQQKYTQQQHLAKTQKDPQTNEPQHLAKTQKDPQTNEPQHPSVQIILFPDEPEAESSEVTKKMKHEG
ncbi:hypothetical protein Tco_1387930 [Tanacetum coccineum]